MLNGKTTFTKFTEPFPFFRFDPKNKISDNFYHRVDGTRAFYFSEDYMAALAKSVGFEVHENRYIAKETSNRKEQICVPRVFIQSKLVKPISEDGV